MAKPRAGARSTIFRQLTCQSRARDPIDNESKDPIMDHMIISAHDSATDKDFRDEQALVDAPPRRSTFLSWLRHDSPYIAMLVFILVGVTLRMEVGYWVALTPVFAVTCVITGWSHFETREARMQLVCAQALDWFALIVATYVLYNSSVDAVLNANASALAVMTLLALGTFVAGVQARVWRICAVGAVLIAAVPTIGWIDQSATLLVAGFLALVAMGGLVWWVDHRQVVA